MIIILYNKFMHAITLIKIFTFHILLSLINLNENIIHDMYNEVKSSNCSEQKIVKLL